MTIEQPQSPLPHHDVLDLVPEFVLGGLSEADTTAVEEHVAQCVDCSSEVEAASVIHRIASSDPEPPPAGLRSRALAAAFRTRPAQTTSDSGPFQAWEAEMGRFTSLLDHPLLGRRSTDDLGSSSWNSMCLRRFDLTIRSMACHLIAAESLWASRLGADTSGTPESEPDLEARTRAVIERHAELLVSATIEELDQLTASVAGAVRALDSDQRQQPSEMIPGFTVDDYLAFRALETWTHADDIRVVLQQQELAPEPIHITTMTSVLPHWVSNLLAGPGAGHGAQNHHYRLELTGAGGQTLDVLPERPQAGRAFGEPDVTVTCDAVEFCKLAAARRDPATFTYEIAGDQRAGRELIHTIAGFEII